MIAQGAEAKLFLDKEGILKQRFEKTYRHPLIDGMLRKQRTRKEAKLLEKLQAMNFPSPRLSDFDDNKMEIRMQEIKGPLLKNVLSDRPEELSREIGRRIAELHNKNIIHGDLTTSNMILDMQNKVNFIDFGLSFTSDRIEDRAVDLHLFKQALESKHYLIFEECFKEALDAYKDSAENAGEILERLEKVEGRGRHKLK
jgi:Kae1-associated kinase Bud32